MNRRAILQSVLAIPALLAGKVFGQHAEVAPPSCANDAERGRWEKAHRYYSGPQWDPPLLPEKSIHHGLTDDEATEIDKVIHGTPLFEVHEHPIGEGRVYKVWADGRIEGFPNGGVIVNRAIPKFNYLLGKMLRGQRT